MFTKMVPWHHQNITEAYSSTFLKTVDLVTPYLLFTLGNFGLFASYSSKHKHNWMEWLQLLGLTQSQTILCQHGAENYLLYEFCYRIIQLVLISTVGSKQKTEKKKQVCDAACFIVTECKFSEGVHQLLFKLNRLPHLYPIFLVFGLYTARQFYGITLFVCLFCCF